MGQPTEIHRTLIHGASGFALTAIWGLFAYRHIAVFAQTGEWPYLVFCISETLQATLFMIRFKPATVSRDPVDWLVAVSGTVAPLFFTPDDTGFGVYGSALVVVGTLLQILGIASLNRSFAIVAAKRRIRTGGMYRIVRHPIYASYLILFSGYLCDNATAWNGGVYLLTLVLIAARIAREERHLCADTQYRDYREHVRYRVVPFLF